MGDKSVETLSNKIEFLSILVTFPPFPPKQCWFFYFFDCTDHSAYTTLNWGAGGIRGLTLEANKIEQMLKYRKASFPKSVSTAFVAHCSSLSTSLKSINENVCRVFQQSFACMNDLESKHIYTQTNYFCTYFSWGYGLNNTSFCIFLLIT